MMRNANVFTSVWIKKVQFTITYVATGVLTYCYWSVNMLLLECVYEFVVNSLSLVKSTYLQEVYFKCLLSHFPAGAYTYCDILTCLFLLSSIPYIRIYIICIWGLRLLGVGVWYGICVLGALFNVRFKVSFWSSYCQSMVYRSVIQYLIFKI